MAMTPFNVLNVATDQKSVCDFLYVNNSITYLHSCTFSKIWWITGPTIALPLTHSSGGEPLTFGMGKSGLKQLERYLCRMA